MARTTGSDGARTEEAIREAAVALIAARGFEATTLREIADKVGVQPGTIYRYFPSKGQLLVELLVEHLEFLLAQWALQRPATGEALELLRADLELAEVLGEAFVTVYTEVKEIEYAEFMKVISPWEREHLLLHV